MAILDTPYFDDLVKHPRWTLVTALVLSYFVYTIGLAYYRLFLSPISKFPGPKLAALTFWYEFYYDVIKDGRYQRYIEKLHDEYGPVIRINPRELHVMDIDFYDVLYSGSVKPRDKWHWNYDAWGVSDSTFATIRHEKHRQRRATLNPFFSKRAVAKLENSIGECVENMCRRFREWQQSQEPLRVRNAYAALTLDVITEYCLANSVDSLSHPDFDREWVGLMDTVIRLGPILRQFKWLRILMYSLPDWVTIKLTPTLASYFRMQGRIRDQVREIQNSPPEELKNDTSTIIHQLLKSDLPLKEKGLERITCEAQSIIGAGQITSADSLERATFELLANPDVLAKLKAELLSAMPNPSQIPSLSTLEQLPYLSAVIFETLRISSVVPVRLQRIAKEDLAVAGYTIPAGVPIGMSTYLMHYRNPYFPDPERFRPERWLVPASERSKLEKYFVPFCKGTRMCLGMNLAQAEMHIALAAIFRRFDLELYQTTAKEIEFCRDYLTSMPYEGSQRLRVMVKR